jgi:hypothetical protein
MMDVKLFLEYLPWLRMPDYYFQSKIGTDGWDAEGVARAIEWSKKDTSPIKRDASILLADAPPSLRKLYAENDLRHIQLLSTFFWSEPKQLGQGWGFADMSEINIVVAPSRKIEAYLAHPVRDMPGATDCLGVLAKDLESYLEALLYAQLNQSHFLKNFLDDDAPPYPRAVLVAKHCALIAGGEEYYPIWANIIGLPPTDAAPQ